MAGSRATLYYAQEEAAWTSLHAEVEADPTTAENGAIIHAGGHLGNSQGEGKEYGPLFILLTISPLALSQCDSLSGWYVDMA